MGNIDAYFSAHEAAYERRYGGISLGTPIGISQEAAYKREIRKRHKVEPHITKICPECGKPWRELEKVMQPKKRCPICRYGGKQ